MSDKKKKGTLWSKMKKVKTTVGSKTAYKNYVINGGRLSEKEWKEVNK